MENMNITVKRSKRKTCEIRLLTQDELEVRVPLFYSNQMVEKLIDSKQHWIYKKREGMRPTLASLKYQLGGVMPIWQRPMTIMSSETSTSYLNFDNSTIQLRVGLTAEQELIKRELKGLLKEELKQYIEGKVIQFSEIMGVKYNQIRIKSIHSRWGSCSSKGNLNFALNLILVPQEIVDYVIIHELAHLRVMNHSKAFWKIVESYYPKYKEARKWLKANAQALEL